ncbi:MAG: hypothetical protein UW15_C0037G0003 [Parcubacteria group bacterium GW2011_GWC1_44_10]|nr:MAG: hypothetical protein UW15_C0037G0003 [Parcubacteria group bacterium GW2011_GWC1_44_10]
MKQSILKALARVKSHEFTKEFKNFEFETKFDLTKRVKLNASNFLRKIEKRFTAGSNFILCKVRGGDKLVTKVAFFAKGNVEYSFFKYRGARMLKVKKHKIIKGIPFNIFKNVEQLLIDKEDFAKKLSRFRRRFRKDGRIYAVAISFCESGGRLQKQLEVEYSGYLNGGFGDFKKENEKQIICRTLELSEHIYKFLPWMLKPSVERKFEFVNKVAP